MGNLKKGDQVLILNGLIRGKIISIENKLSHINGNVLTLYVIRENNNLTHHYYAYSDNVIGLNDYFLVKNLYGLED